MMLFVANALASVIGRLRGEDSERGATAVEYGLMVTLIAAVIVAVVAAVGQFTDAGFDTVCNELNTAITTGPAACPA